MVVPFHGPLMLLPSQNPFQPKDPLFFIRARIRHLLTNPVKRGNQQNSCEFYADLMLIFLFEHVQNDQL